MFNDKDLLIKCLRSFQFDAIWRVKYMKSFREESAILIDSICIRLTSLLHSWPSPMLVHLFHILREENPAHNSKVSYGITR